MTDFSCLLIWSGAVKENCGGEEKRKATFWERVFAVMLVPRGIMLGKVYLMLSHRFIEVEWVWQQRRPGKEDRKGTISYLLCPGSEFKSNVIYRVNKSIEVVPHK